MLSSLKALQVESLLRAHLNLIIIALLFGCFFPVGASANTYHYQGLSLSGGDPGITGSLEVSGRLPSNSTFSLFFPGPCGVPADALCADIGFSSAFGVGYYANYNGSGSGSISTDGFGNIISWRISLEVINTPNMTALSGRSTQRGISITTQGDSEYISERCIRDCDGYVNPSRSAANNTQGYWYDTTVPEPATWFLMVLGFAGLGFVRRRRLMSC